MTRLRFAPSPTGNLHLGTLRTALFAWLYARNTGGKIVLRIEDTDLNRSDSSYEQSILDGLTWLGLTMDEGPVEGGDFGPYRQSERISEGRYQAVADALLASGQAYYCFSTAEELDAEREAAKAANRPYVYSGKYANLDKTEVQKRLDAGDDYTIRFKMPNEADFTFNDLIRGDISIDLSLISDFVIMKSDGSPSYNFACVVDDSDMVISHVVRGEDHISNTPKQIKVYEALGKPVPIFAHLPMILGADKSKLSKRHGATNVVDYREMGIVAEALFNYMTLLGWSHPDGTELLSVDEIVAAFSLERVSKSSAVFDMEKLTWMNGQYIRSLNEDAYLALVKPYISEDHFAALNNRYDAETIDRILCLLQDSLTLLSDINGQLSVFLMDEAAYETAVSDCQFPDTSRDVIIKFLAGITEDQVLDEDRVHAILAEVLSETGLGKGKVFRPVRMASTGMGSGPDLATVLSIVGKETLAKRLEWSLSHGPLSA